MCAVITKESLPLGDGIYNDAQNEWETVNKEVIPHGPH